MKNALWQMIRNFGQPQARIMTCEKFSFSALIENQFSKCVNCLTLRMMNHKLLFHFYFPRLSLTNRQVGIWARFITLITQSAYINGHSQNSPREFQDWTFAENESCSGSGSKEIIAAYFCAPVRLSATATRVVRVKNPPNCKLKNWPLRNKLWG